MTWFKPTSLRRAVLLAVPVIAAQVAISQVQSDLGVTPLSAAVAQEEKKKPQRETRRTPALRNKVYEKLAEAQAAAEAKDLPGASRILDAMIAGEGKKSLNSYELANVYNLYAFIYYSRENYSKALQSYEKVVAQPDLPLAMEINTRFTIAQLYFVQEQWQKGIDALLKWFKMTDTPNPNAYVLLAQGYYQLKDYDKALVNVNKAITCTTRSRRRSSRANASRPRSSGITWPVFCISRRKTSTRRWTCSKNYLSTTRRSNIGCRFPTCTVSRRKKPSSWPLWKLPMYRACWTRVQSRSPWPICT